MFAVFESGGKQHRVAEGDVVQVEKLAVEPGEDVTFEHVLMVADDDKVDIGTPLVEGGVVVAEVLSNTQLPKVRGVKFKRRKNYLRRIGHRQQATVVKIKSISQKVSDGT